MREPEGFAPPESRHLPSDGGRDILAVEQMVVDEEQANLRQIESKRTKVCVLIGSGIIQLPIWGTFDLMSGKPRYSRTHV